MIKIINIFLISSLLIFGCGINATKQGIKSQWLLSDIPEVWLVEKVSLSRADTYFRTYPGSAIRDDWEELKKMMISDDKLWFFRSPPETWAALSGKEGFVIVRKGKPFKGLVTKIN